MLLIDFPYHAPKCAEVATYSIKFYDKENQDTYPESLRWLEDCGYTFCVIPCEDGLFIIQWYGEGEHTYFVQEIGK